MTTQASYTPEEWNILVHAPVQASLLVINADQRGGISGRFDVIQETRDAQTAIERAAQTATTPLVQEAAQTLAAEKSWGRALQKETPETITTILQRVPTILTSKAGQDEVLEYKRYVLDIAQKTASAVKESGEKNTSPKEAVALQQIAGMLELTT
jgi:hypothetical protein